MDTIPGGHWTRNLILSADQTKLYVAVGSQSNIGDAGMAVEKGRACIYELDLATEKARIFGSGPPQSRRHGLGAHDQRALDRGQRARRPRRRDARPTT